MRIARDVTALIGDTPLVALDRFAAARGLGARLLAKVEASNPRRQREGSHCRRHAG